MQYFKLSNNIFLIDKLLLNLFTNIQNLKMEGLFV